MSQNLAYLETIFPRQAVLPVLKVGEIIGLAPQTVRNRLNSGTFPIPTFSQGSRRMCLKQSVANYLDGIGEMEKPKSRRGPKTKAERIASGVAS